MPPHRFIIRQYPEDTADDGPEHQCLSEVRGECFAMFCCEVGRPCGLLVSGVFKDEGCINVFHLLVEVERCIIAF